jgi:sulfate adenylyltransferase large subunit
VRATSSELLRFATAGSVDDGKSTLIGRLLYDTKAIFEDQLEQVAQASERRHGAGNNGSSTPDLALLTDGLRAEREQGITIDVAYRYFTTPKRSFIIADTPGHVRYTRNMVTGASTADLALVLVDARNGVVEQSRRHAYIASLLRIPHIVVCVNKMDLVDWSEEAYEQVERDFSDFAAQLDVPDITYIPISALQGDNVVERSLEMHWYDGPTLLHHLEHVHIASDRNLQDLRFPVQWVVRPGSAGDHELHDYRGYAGQVAGGVLHPGDEVVVLPSGARSRVSSIDTFDGPVDAAYPPMSVTVRLEDDLDISRGDVLARPQNRPSLERHLDATICWMSETPSRPGGRYLIKHQTRTTKVVVEALTHRVDVTTLALDTDADRLELNDIGRVSLRTAVPLAFDPYARNRLTGSFILIDEVTNDTVAAGMLTGRATGADSAAGTLTREERWERLGLRGGTVWLSGDAADAVAAALETRLVELGTAAARVTVPGVDTAVAVADAGVVAIVAGADAEPVRAAHVAAGLDFVAFDVDGDPAVALERVWPVVAERLG